MSSVADADSVAGIVKALRISFGNTVFVFTPHAWPGRGGWRVGLAAVRGVPLPDRSVAVLRVDD